MVFFLYRFITAVSLIFLSDAGIAVAQQIPDAEFGVIPDSLLQMQPSGEHSDASYIITSKEADISFVEDDSSIVAVIRHHIRLKILDEKAREASIVAIPYYFDNGMERIKGVKGATYLPSGKRISLQQDDIRTINLNARYNVLEFTMPRVEAGAVVEYAYTIHRRYIEELPDFFLSHKVPTSVAKLSITYPQYLRYQPFILNYGGKVHHSTTRLDTSSVPKIFTIPQPEPVITETWVAYDVPPVEDEPLVSSLNNYRGKIKFLMSRFGLPRQPLENSWEVVVAKLRKESNPLQQINENKLAASIGDSIAQANSSVTKAAIQDSIYRYLNRKANFSGIRSPFSTTADSVVLAGQAAGQAAINQTLIAMLRGAGIEANPVLVSTRESGNINKEFPSFYQFNAMMVQSELEGRTYIMDASMPFSEPGLIPVEMNNNPGLVMKANSFEWVEFQPEKSFFAIEVDVTADLNPDGTLTGQIVSTQNGYAAQMIREQIADGLSEAELFKRVLFDRFSQIEVENVQVENVQDYNQPVKLTGQFTIERYAASFTDGLGYRPMLVGALAENPFKDRNRDLPITLNAREKLDFSYHITLPAGFELKEGRQNRSLNFAGAEFTEAYAAEENMIQYDFHIDINRTHFSVNVFPQLYRFYERWVALSNARWMIEK